MVATDFFKVTNDAYGKIASDQLNNTTATLDVDFSDPASADRFPASGTTIVYIHSDSFSLDSPYLDINLEVALIVDVPSSGTISLQRDNPIAHAGTPWIQIPVLQEHVSQIQAAISYLETREVIGYELTGTAGTSLLTLPEAVDVGSVKLFRNAARQREGEAADFTIDGLEITLAVEIVEGEVFAVDYYRAP